MILENNDGILLPDKWKHDKGEEARHYVHRAFGYLIMESRYFENSVVVNPDCEYYEQDETTIYGPLTVNIPGALVKAKSPVINSTIELLVEGQIHITNVETGEIHERKPGYCNLNDELKPGRYKCRVVKNTQKAKVFAYWPDFASNIKKIVPDLKYFKLLEGETYNAPVGTKLFLAKGTLKIDDQNLDAVKQIKIETTDKTFLALADCYGFLFP
jgi:hypothetical protein